MRLPAGGSESRDSARQRAFPSLRPHIAPSPAAGEMPHDEKEKHRAAERDDETADAAAPELGAARPEDERAAERSDDADDRVAGQTEAVTTHDVARKPCGKDAGDDQRQHPDQAGTAIGIVNENVLPSPG